MALIAMRGRVGLRSLAVDAVGFADPAAATGDKVVSSRATYCKLVQTLESRKALLSAADIRQSRADDRFRVNSSKAPSPRVQSSSPSVMSILPDTRQAPSTSADAEPTLRSVTAPSGYVFPAIWSFPPFFTYVNTLLAELRLTRSVSLQPNPQTFAHQIGLWTQLLLSWAKFHRVFTLDAGAVDGGDCRDVFHNTAINSRSSGCSATRADTCAGRLQPPAIKQFVSHLLKEGECVLVPIDLR
jgi:hypothetical protein